MGWYESAKQEEPESGWSSNAWESQKNEGWSAEKDWRQSDASWQNSDYNSDQWSGSGQKRDGDQSAEGWSKRQKIDDSAGPPAEDLGSRIPSTPIDLPPFAGVSSFQSGFAQPAARFATGGMTATGMGAMAPALPPVSGHGAPSTPGFACGAVPGTPAGAPSTPAGRTPGTPGGFAGALGMRMPFQSLGVSGLMTPGASGLTTPGAPMHLQVQQQQAQLAMVSRQTGPSRPLTWSDGSQMNLRYAPRRKSLEGKKEAKQGTPAMIPAHWQTKSLPAGEKEPPKAKEAVPDFATWKKDHHKEVRVTGHRRGERQRASDRKAAPAPAVLPVVKVQQDIGTATPGMEAAIGQGAATPFMPQHGFGETTPFIPTQPAQTADGAATPFLPQQGGVTPGLPALQGEMTPFMPAGGAPRIGESTPTLRGGAQMQQVLPGDGGFTPFLGAGEATPTVNQQNRQAEWSAVFGINPASGEETPKINDPTWTPRLPAGAETPVQLIQPKQEISHAH